MRRGVKDADDCDSDRQALSLRLSHVQTQPVLCNSGEHPECQRLTVDEYCLNFVCFIMRRC